MEYITNFKALNSKPTPLETMITHYGFTDGTGDWYLVLDTDKCNGCGECVEVCPQNILEVGQDEIDIFREKPVASIKQEARKKIRYHCAPCKPGYGIELPPCVTACKPGAISHSEGWKQINRCEKH